MRKHTWKIIIPAVLAFSLILTMPGSLAEDNPAVQTEPDSAPSNAEQGEPATETENGQNNSPEIKLAFAGDVILERHMEGLIQRFGKDYIFALTKNYFKAADLAMVNLETPVSTRGQKEKDKQFTFRANPVNISLLREAGINVVSLANNHTLDFGKAALADTFKYLDKEGILYAGAGKDKKTAYMPRYLERKGVKIAVIAASRVIPFITWYPGKNTAGVASTYNPEEVKNSIVLARKNADIVIVYAHWGKERTETPDKYQKELARLYIDCGADIVIGSHPHVLQGLEFYKGKLIAYSLGNFVFTDLKKDSMILNITIKDGKIASTGIIPCRISTFRPAVIKDKKEIKVLMDKMRKLSYNTIIDGKGGISPTKR